MYSFVNFKKYVATCGYWLYLTCKEVSHTFGRLQEAVGIEHSWLAEIWYYLAICWWGFLVIFLKKLWKNTDLPLVSSSWSFNFSRSSAISPWEVPASSTDSRRHWMKRSRKSDPLLGSTATNLSTFTAWVACSVSSSWKSAVIKWYWFKYDRRIGTSSLFLNLTWYFRRTVSPTKSPPERRNGCYYTAIASYCSTN